MFCTKCGSKNPDIALYCGKCGKPLKVNLNTAQQKLVVTEQNTQAPAVQRPKRKRMITIGIIAAVLVIGVVAGLLDFGTYDPTQKEIENMEGQKVTIISKKIISSVNSKNVTAGSVIDYSVYYNYSLSGGSVKSYSQETGLKIKISPPSLAAIENNNSVTIANGAKSGATLKVTVKYKKLSEVFDYTIK